MDELIERLRQLRLLSDDTLTIVDNTRDGVVPVDAGFPAMRIVTASDRQSSYHARNRGAYGGRQDWLVFLDADVEPTADLLDLYLAPQPAPQTAVLVGSVRDLGPAPGRRESLAVRYARLRRLIDQDNTLRMARPYAKTANCAVRRAAFEAVGGFADDIRSGGDADLCFRLRDGGWEFELRPEATVGHRGRQHLLGLLGQRARHGSGAEWLEVRYPGFVGPRRRVAGVARNLVEGVVRALMLLLRGRRDQAVIRLLDPVSNAAFELGRRVPNTTWREQPSAQQRFSGAGVLGARLRRQ